MNQDNKHMVNPIKGWPKLKRGFLFGQKYPASFQELADRPHLGLDIICPSGTPIVAWQDLTVKKYALGKQGGHTIHIVCPDNARTFRLMHLLLPVKTGDYKEGEMIAQVGSTGTASSGPHLHIDITKCGRVDIKNFAKFEDPEAYFRATIK